MRKLPAIAAMLLITLLCGCATELSERAIIQAAAVDIDGDEYTVHALLFSGGGTDGIDTSKENVVKVSGSGKTLSEAVKEISLVSGKEIYMAENKLLILGEGFEDNSVMTALNALYYDMRCSLNMPVCCAEDAELLTDLRFVEGITSAEQPAEILKTAASIGTSPYTTLMDILTDYEGGRATLIPEFTEGQNGDGLTADKDGKLPVLSGSRLLLGGRLSEPYDSLQTEALLILSGDSDACYYSFILDGREYSIKATDIKTEILRDEDGISLDISAKYTRENGAELTSAALETAQRLLREKLSLPFNEY